MDAIKEKNLLACLEANKLSLEDLAEYLDGKYDEYVEVSFCCDD